MENSFSMELRPILDDVQTINMSPQELKRIADKAMESMQASIEEEAPYKRGRLKRSIKKISKVRGLSAEVTVYVGAWYAKSLNDGNSESREHVGWFDRAVDNNENEIFEEVQRLLRW